MQSVEVEKIALNGLNIKVKRQVNGDIDWMDYIKVDSEEEAIEMDENISDINVSTPWNILVKDVVFEKISLAFEDSAVKPNVKSDLNELNLYAQNVTLLGQEPFAYQMDMLINETIGTYIDQ